MINEGFPSDRDIETLSVNGFVDPLLRLPALIGLLTSLRDEMLARRVDAFVGIDSNFFNLLLAGMLKKRGIKTVQYVSPTVWAWRPGRIKKIKRSVDLMMTLYPFEKAIYEAHDVPVRFVGHPRADDIGFTEGPDLQSTARTELGIDQGSKVVTILPGSRASEVRTTGTDFLATAALAAGKVDRFVIPAANAKRHAQIEELLLTYPAVAAKTTLTSGESRRAMTAADVVLVNSGTATLEAMLLRKPMVMSYRLGKLTYGIVSRLVTTDWFALPNILAEETLVPEFIQDAADPEEMARTLMDLLDSTDNSRLLKRFDEIHRLLKQNDNPGSEAARVVLELATR